MLASALTLVALQTVVPTCRTADARVERMIASTAAESKGVEYCQFRMYHTIDDVDGDLRDDFIVVFSVEAPAGGNDARQFLAVLPSRTRVARSRRRAEASWRTSSRSRRPRVGA